jgi:hypothetical protein
MAAITKASAVNVKPLEGAIVRRVQLGATVTAPSPITLQSDGKWDGTDTSAAQLTVAVAVQSGVDTDWVDAVFFGPVVALSGATIGSLVYGSDTAGAFDTAVGTKDLVIGFAETAAVLFVEPQIIDFS